MAQSTITDSTQSTNPPEARPDELFGSLTLNRLVADTRTEKHAAREAIAQEASTEAWACFDKTDRGKVGVG